MICPYCGKGNISSSKVCTQCGHDLLKYKKHIKNMKSTKDRISSLFERRIFPFVKKFKVHLAFLFVLIISITVFVTVGYNLATP